MLGNRHQFNMGEAQRSNISDQAPRQFLVIQIVTTLIPLPRAQVDFVNRKRSVSPVLSPSPRHPNIIAPWIRHIFHDQSRIGRASLETATIGIAFIQPLTGIPDPNLKPIARTHACIGDKQFPNTATAAQQMAQTIPTVEVARHANLSGVRRPDREQHPSDIIHHPRMRTQNTINMQVATFVKQVQIIQAELRRKAVGIMNNPLIAGGIDPGQPVMQGQRISRAPPLKQIGIRQSPQRLIKIGQLSPLSARQERPDNHLLTAAMATKHRKRIGVKTLAQEGRISPGPVPGR